MYQNVPKCTKMYQNVLKYSRDRQTINGNELSRQENAIFMQDIYAKNTEVQLWHLILIAFPRQWWLRQHV